MRFPLEVAQHAELLKSRCDIHISFVDDPDDLHHAMPRGWRVVIVLKGGDPKEPRHDTTTAFCRTGPVILTGASLEWCLERAMTHALNRTAWFPELTKRPHDGSLGPQAFPDGLKS